MLGCFNIPKEWVLVNFIFWGFLAIYYVIHWFFNGETHISLEDLITLKVVEDKTLQIVQTAAGAVDTSNLEVMQPQQNVILSFIKRIMEQGSEIINTLKILFFFFFFFLLDKK